MWTHPKESCLFTILKYSISKRLTDFLHSSNVDLNAFKDLELKAQSFIWTTVLDKNNSVLGKVAHVSCRRSAVLLSDSQPRRTKKKALFGQGKQEPVFVTASESGDARWRPRCVQPHSLRHCWLLLHCSSHCTSLELNNSRRPCWVDLA